MATHNPPPQDKDFWEDIRETVRDGIHEIQTVGDDLARQARLRMDIFQTERRLKSVYGALGEAAFRLLNANHTISTDDSAISELSARITYYSDELGRLRNEQKQKNDTA